MYTHLALEVKTLLDPLNPPTLWEAASRLEKGGLETRLARFPPLSSTVYTHLALEVKTLLDPPKSPLKRGTSSQLWVGSPFCKGG